MDLTSLIWHLAALLAALWASLAYRSLVSRYRELQEGLVVSLLSGPRLQGKIASRRSARIRALRWFSEELSRIHRRAIRVDVCKGDSELLQADHSLWCEAMCKLHDMSQDKNFPLSLPEDKAILLCWASAARKENSSHSADASQPENQIGQWQIMTEQGRQV
ncbi:hypothetical protein EBU99_05590 [bacterium]|nr:hypothetical protein [bacterium]